MVLPSGLATDRGAAPLRRALIDRTRIDSLISLENRERHVSGSSQPQVPPALRHGWRTHHHDPVPFRHSRARTPSTGCRSAVRIRSAVALTRPLLEQLSGEQIAVPDVRSRRDVEILHAIAFTTPALGDPDGWHVRFGRELNATDDRRHFARGLDVGEQGFRSSKASTSLRSSSTSPERICGLPPTWRRRWSIRREHSDGQAGVSGGRVGDEPADAHRRHRARGHHHDAHGLLPQGPAGRRVSVVSVRHAQQLSSPTISCGSASARTSPRASSTGCPCRHLDRTHLASAKSSSSARHSAERPLRSRRARAGSRRWPLASTASNQPSFITFSIRFRSCRGPIATRL